MNIALDYDGTFTEDPTLWSCFAALAAKRGHTVTIVTMRYPSEPIPDMPLPIVYTSRKAKAVAFKADIWIDDKPHWLVTDSA